MKKDVIKLIAENLEEQVNTGRVMFEQGTDAGRISMQKIAMQLEAAFSQDNEEEKLRYYNALNLLRNKKGTKLYDFLTQLITIPDEDPDITK